MPNHTLNDTHLGSLSVFLQSKDATVKLNEDKNSSCLFYLKQAISPPPDTQIMVGLISAEIPYTFYNIDSRNNKITIETQLNGTANVTLTPKNYGTTSLTKALNDALTSVQTTVTFDEDTNKFTFANVGGFKIKSTTMKTVLGIGDNQVDQTFVLSLTTEKVCNLSGTSSIYVNCTNLSVTNLDSRGDLNGVIAKLNVTVNPGEFIFFQQTETQYYIINDREIQFFGVSLTDDNNELLDLNGVEFSIALTINFCKIRIPSIADEYLVDRRNIPYMKELEAQQAEEKRKKKK